MRTASQIFEEELSGEPLTQESVIEGIKLARKEVCDEIKILFETHYSYKILLQILKESLE
jgi:hypothetical protein